VRTRHLQLVTLKHLDTTSNRESVRSHFGPVNPGSTTWLAQKTLRANQDHQLTELLSSLENEVASLVSKSCTVLDTCNTVSQEVSAVLSSIATEGAGTDE
jgi:hypothetical protein